MSELRGALGVIRTPIDKEHPQTASYTSLPWKDVENKFFVQESIQGPRQHLLEAFVKPVQNVAERILRER